MSSYHEAFRQWYNAPSGVCLENGALVQCVLLIALVIVATLAIAKR